MIHRATLAASCIFESSGTNWMNRLISLYIGWGAMIIIMPVSVAVADRDNSALDRYQTRSPQPSGINEQKAIAIAQQHFKGRILAINHSDNIYRIKILSNQGTVHSILINATNGAVISTH